jgi:hypothetical protein
MGKMNKYLICQQLWWWNFFASLIFMPIFTQRTNLLLTNEGGNVQSAAPSDIQIYFNPSFSSCSKTNKTSFKEFSFNGDINLPKKKNIFSTCNYRMFISERTSEKKCEWKNDFKDCNLTPQKTQFCVCVRKKRNFNNLASTQSFWLIGKATAETSVSWNKNSLVQHKITKIVLLMQDNAIELSLRLSFMHPEC